MKKIIFLILMLLCQRIPSALTLIPDSSQINCFIDYTTELNLKSKFDSLKIHDLGTRVTQSVELDSNLCAEILKETKYIKINPWKKFTAHNDPKIEIPLKIYWGQNTMELILNSKDYSKMAIKVKGDYYLIKLGKEKIIEELKIFENKVLSVNNENIKIKN